MTTLYLVRHGETIDNALQLMQGQIQGELNDTGIAQATRVSEELADRHFDAIVASDLKRAIDTAKIIARPHGLSVVTTPLLRERDWGDFTGRYIPELKGQPWPDNVEPIDKLLDRAGRFLDFIRNEYEGKCVLAVGHGIVNKAIQAVHRGCQMTEVERMVNAEVRVLTL
ncbi:MAG: histidine phosphatase family protein [Prevotella sp.]|nr:histidine phosphatase family protein [Prevotella sp.]